MQIFKGKLNKILLQSIVLFFVMPIFISFKVEAKTLLQVKKITWMGNKVLIIVIPASANIRPAASLPGHNVRDWAKMEGAIVAINGGYFNHSDGWPVSKVFFNGNYITEPEKNQALLNNITLKPFLSKIFNERVELRIISGNKKLIWEIVPHNYKVKNGQKIIHSLQAGPQLLPIMDLEKEGFIIKNKNGVIIRDGIGSQLKASRSAIGIKGNGEMLFVGVSSISKGRGITISELAKLMKELKAVSAMALDGGSSTSLAWKENNIWNTFVGSGNSLPQVNSALTVIE